MFHGMSDDDIIRSTHNTARFFTVNRQIAWVLLVGTLLWGAYGYIQMPKRKDPLFPINYAAAVGVWPGASAERIEQLITRKIEERVAENPLVDRIESTSRSNVSIVVIRVNERTPDPSREWDDIALRLNSIRDLPPGAPPIEFIKDFGETAALMLTVASPKVDAVELSLRGARHPSRDRPGTGDHCRRRPRATGLDGRCVPGGARAHHSGALSGRGRSGSDGRTTDHEPRAALGGGIRRDRLHGCS